MANTLATGIYLKIFATTDEAFEKLPAGTVEALLQPENKSKLTAILSYHVLPRKLSSNHLSHKAIHVRTIKSGGHRLLRVRKSRGGVTVDKANVVKAGIRTRNAAPFVLSHLVLE